MARQLEGTATISRLAVPAVTLFAGGCAAKPPYNSALHLPTGRKIALGRLQRRWPQRDLIMCPGPFFTPGRCCHGDLAESAAATFTIGTSEVAEAYWVHQAGVNNIFVADFNGDGKPDVFARRHPAGQDPDASNPDISKSHPGLREPARRVSRTRRRPRWPAIPWLPPSVGDGRHRRRRLARHRDLRIGWLQGSGQATGPYFRAQRSARRICPVHRGAAVDLASTGFTGPNPCSSTTSGPVR